MKISLFAMAAIAALGACSVAARTNAQTPVLAVSPPAIAAQTIASSAAPAAAQPMHATAEPRAINEAVSCEIRSRRTSNGLLIQARAIADRDISGEYDLVITKSGAAGSSDISQGGPVDLAAGASTILGENEISVERGARVRAVLSVRDEGGQVCRRSFNL